MTARRNQKPSSTIEKHRKRGLPNWLLPEITKTLLYIICRATRTVQTWPNGHSEFFLKKSRLLFRRDSYVLLIQGGIS